MIDTEGLTIPEYLEKRLFNYVVLSGGSQANTFSVYKSHLYRILNRFPNPEKTTLLQIQDFCAEIEKDVSRKNRCVVVRWLYNKVLGRNIEYYELPYPRKKKKVQPVYSFEEAMKILNIIENEKHKALVALIIDCGLRISEPCKIVIKDCHSKERSIVLRGNKGDNDRIIYPSEPVWKYIKIYWKEFKKQITDTYLFDGERRGCPYTTSSVRAIIKKACFKSGVEYKKVHAFRRFNITWSVENKIPISVVADKCGNSSRTIEKHYLIHSPTYLKSLPTPLTQC